MPYYERGDTSIYFEERGSGFPLLLLAPGGMKSAIDFWKAAAVDPWESYADDFRLIAMDQRNAGHSRGPLAVDDPWGAYAADQLGLLDHLGVDRFLVMGCCIGGSFILKLIEQEPHRVAAAVLEQPIGVEDSNCALFGQMQAAWASEVSGGRDDIDLDTAERFLAAMWGRDFVVSVAPEVISASTVPMLVLPGIDDYHPTETGRQIARMAPNAELFEPWKETPELVVEATTAVRRFLLAHAGS